MQAQDSTRALCKVPLPTHPQDHQSTEQGVLTPEDVPVLLATTSPVGVSELQRSQQRERLKVMQRNRKGEEHSC